MRVGLTWAEIRIGSEIAAIRRLRGLSGQVVPRHGAGVSGLGFDMELQAVLAEIATCKALDVYWPGFGLSVGGVDCGVAEVRSVDRDSKRLILHKNDSDDVPWVSALVTLPDLPFVTLRGWIMGIDAKQERNWGDPAGGRPAYFVDTADLRPMDELLERMKRMEIA